MPRPDSVDARVTAMEVGDRVRAARVAAGLTQAALAARLGVTQPWVYQVEAGRHVPVLGRLAEIARATGRPPSSLHPWLRDRAIDPEDDGH